MDDTQVTLVKSSWAQVEPIAPTAATLFYDRLFSVAPGVRPLFPDDISEQKRKLMEMIGVVVDGLDDLPSIVGDVQALGARHAGYGAKPEHYPVVGDCLLWTLGQGLGDGFTPDVKEAWTEAYQILATTMIAAAATNGSQSAAA
jgi:hemoglobin-like flavoprotein